MKSNWITKFLEPLIKNKCDYVIPIYKRSRYEGSTTNHFAFPLIYAISGIPIRQPIAGDFSFNRAFIELIVKQPINNAIKHYGIDIFMTLTACCNNLNIHQIELEKKIHNPSYNKMESMFKEVLDSFIFTWISLKRKEIKWKKKANILSNPQKNICIINSRKFNHKERAKEFQKIYKVKLPNANNIEGKWITLLKELVLTPETIDKEKIKYIFAAFMNRATKFWLNSEYMSAKTCENLIVIQAHKLYSSIEKERKIK